MRHLNFFTATASPLRCGAWKIGQKPDVAAGQGFADLGNEIAPRALARLDAGDFIIGPVWGAKMTRVLAEGEEDVTRATGGDLGDETLNVETVNADGSMPAR